MISETCPLEESASHHFQHFVKSVADPHLQRADSELGVDTVAINFEKYYNSYGSLFIRIQFDHRKLGEKGFRAELREDLLISATCPLEESASHHDP